MNAIGLIVELFLSGLGSTFDLLARFGFKILLGMLAVGVALFAWHLF